MIFLHIGWRKAGSTGLQFYLEENRNRLARAGIVLVGNRSGKFERGGGWDGKPFELERFDWDVLLDAVRTAPEGGSVVASSEGMFRLDPAAVRERLDDEPVTVVLYLRRQDLVLESEYKQQIKTRPVKPPFSKWATQHKPRLLDYLAVAKAWEAAFGREHVIVRRLDPEIGVKDVREDFRAIIARDTRLKKPRGGRNASPRREICDLLRMADRAGLPVDRKALLQSTKRLKFFEHNSDLLAPADRSALIAEYADENEELKQRYFPEAAGPLFAYSEPEAEPGLVASSREYRSLLRHFLAALGHEPAAAGE